MKAKYFSFAIFIILAVGCVSLGEQFYRGLMALNSKPDIDEVTRFEGRFVTVKKDLPDSGMIGYTTNQGEGSFKEYGLTVYALSPLMPVPGRHGEFLVGNFIGPVESWRLPPNRAVRSLKNYGNGIVLIRCFPE